MDSWYKQIQVTQDAVNISASKNSASVEIYCIAFWQGRQYVKPPVQVLTVYYWSTYFPHQKAPINFMNPQKWHLTVFDTILC